uniref:Uncharacterized protein n=1 Tax=Dichotomaria marginata TaxID=268567 RepID=A0A1G4NSB9_9FLOR|nr:Hypothetical protein ycf23 [Dichotomaria marginata]SCW21505.1 Hypothetical protein ycf23 [Dichotomaria marginata]
MTLNLLIEDTGYKKRILKVVLGLNNFTLQSLIPTIKSVEIADATYIDLTANLSLFKQICLISYLPIDVSLRDINELISFYSYWADLLDIGHFDIFYCNGISFYKQQLFNMAYKIRKKCLKHYFV